jgi:tetratricopeptide (TPR) repeat protein
MTRRGLGRAGWVLVGVAAGCAYYNGLYNANRLMGEAETAREQGRSGEARALYAQAAVKAESVAVRHPSSKWRDDALLLWGQSLRRGGECDEAVQPLQLAVDSSPDPTLRERAALELGACRVVIGEPDAAAIVLAPLLEAGDSAIAAGAALWKGRAELARGASGAAIQDLLRAPPDSAAFDLARAYGAADSVSVARAVLQAQLAAPYEEDRWILTLDFLGARDLQAATDLTDDLVARSDLTAGERARLLLADGERWDAIGEWDHAAGRYTEAVRAAPDSLEGGVAGARLVLVDVKRAADPADLPELLERSRAVAERGGEAARLVGPAERLLREVVQALEPPVGADDAVRLFGVAEALRDSLEAPKLAAALFWRIAQDHPASFVAPKALLAAAALEPERAAAALSLLTTRYRDSPYALALSGEGLDAFRAAEDSLRVLRAAARRQP